MLKIYFLQGLFTLQTTITIAMNSYLILMQGNIYQIFYGNEHMPL